MHLLPRPMISLSRPQSSGGFPPTCDSWCPFSGRIFAQQVYGGALDSSRLGVGSRKGQGKTLYREPPSRSTKPSRRNGAGRALSSQPSTSFLPDSTVRPPAALGHLSGCVLHLLKICHPGFKKGVTDRQRRPPNPG